MKKYNYILFDADGTLFDFIRCEEVALRLALRRMNIEIEEIGVRMYSEINESLWKALERGEIEKEKLRVRRFELFGHEYGFDCDFNKLSENYTDALSCQCFLMDGAFDLCRALQGQYRLFIITNGIESVQKKRFSLAPFRDCFESLFISGEIGYEKPSAKFFDIVANRINGFDREKALVVGDSLTSDMRGGIAAGIDCCFYNPAKKEVPEDMCQGIQYQIEHLLDLKEILA